MNKIYMTGYLTRDPELREGSERSECKLRIAVHNGPYPTTFIDVQTFDRQAEACAAYLRKGRRVGVDGTLALREWTAPDGTSRQRYSVIGRVEFLDRPQYFEQVSQGQDGSGGSDEAREAQPELALA